MKNILLLLALLSTFVMSSFTNEAEIKMAAVANENARLCKIFTDKVETYESTMRNDGLAEATLVSYKQRMSSFCDASSVRSQKVKVKTVTEVLNVDVKDVATVNENVRLCNVFTKKVETYESTMRNDDLAEATLVSYKQRMSSYCNSNSVKS